MWTVLFVKRETTVVWFSCLDSALSKADVKDADAVVCGSQKTRRNKEGKKGKKGKKGKRDQVILRFSRCSFLSSFSLFWSGTCLAEAYALPGKDGPGFQVPHLDHHHFWVGFLFSVFYFSFSVCAACATRLSFLGMAFFCFLCLVVSVVQKLGARFSAAGVTLVMFRAWAPKYAR